MERTLKRSVGSLVATGCLALSALAPSFATHATPIADTFHQTIPQFETFLKNVDDMDEVLWDITAFDEQQVWELILHSAIAAQSEQLEATAHRELVRLGVTESEMADLYTLNPDKLSEKQIATLVYAQRSGVLPTKINANDIIELRKHYDAKELTELTVINAYINMFSLFYDSGYVEVDTTKFYPSLKANVDALNQQKINTNAGWSDRHYFESGVISPEVSMPFLDMDRTILLDPHSFDPQEIWEMFVIAQKASDCKHCVTHGAFGMHLAYADPQEIINAYNYDGSGDYSAKEKARFDYLRAAITLPSQVKQSHIDALEQHYNTQEVQHIITYSAFVGLLSTYMQTTAVVTDAESADFTVALLGPHGFDLGRHTGGIDEQRMVHPTTMYRLSDNSKYVELERAHLWSGHVMDDILLNYTFPGLPGPLLHAVSQVLLLLALLFGYRKFVTK